MESTHREQVKALLGQAAADHETLVAQLPANLQASLPVDAQGVTRAIDLLAVAAGLDEDARRALLIAHPPPVRADGDDVVPALRATYAAHERAALLLAERLDAQ